MKKTVKIQTFLWLTIFIALPFFAASQEKTTEKKVTVKTIKDVNGKQTVIDTTFTLSEDDDVQKIVKELTWEAEGDSNVRVIADVDIESEIEVDGNKKVIIMKTTSDNKGKLSGKEENVIVTLDDDGNKKVIVRSLPDKGSGHKVMKFKSEDGEGEEVIIISPQRGSHKTIKWIGEDGEEHNIDMDQDFNFEWHGEGMGDEFAELNDEMRAMQFELLQENRELNDELIEWKFLQEMERPERLRELEYFASPSSPEFRFNEDFFRYENSDQVTDMELRDAGIKNKENRLELNELDIDNENGVIDLSFSMKAEGSPKVSVYNVYGDKVFSGKPALMNSKYEIKMDLSQKQHGTYYLMIVAGDASKSIRLQN